jgi:Fe-S cluster assembly iron-binding protein IscA
MLAGAQLDLGRSTMQGGCQRFAYQKIARKQTQAVFDSAQGIEPVALPGGKPCCALADQIIAGIEIDFPAEQLGQGFISFHVYKQR